MVSNPFQDGISVKIDGDSQGLGAAIGSAKSSLGDFKTAALGAGAVVGGGLAAGLTASVKAAASFEEAMIEVEKVTDPETADAMAESIKNMSEEMPIAQEELAGITEQAARLGIEGRENLESYTRTAARMATATDLTADEAADSFARIGTLMDIPIEQSENLGSAMNTLANTMGTSSSEITDVMTRAGGALNSLGVGKEQALALAGAMNEVSPSSRLAAGGMKRMAEAMMDPSNAEALSNALGMTQEEFKRMRDENPSDTLLQVAEAANSSKDTANLLRGELGEAGSEFVTLGQNTDSAREATERAQQAWKENTSLQEEAASASSTFSAQLQMVKNRFRNMGIEVGTRVLPHLKSFLDAIVQGIGVLSDLNKRLDGALLAGAAAAAISILAAAAWAAVPALWAMAAPLLPAAAAVAAVAAAVGALYYAVQNNILGLGDIFDSVMGVVTSALERAMSVIDRLVTITRDLLSGDFAAAWSGIKDLVADGVSAAIGWLTNAAIPAFVGAVTDASNAIVDYLEQDAADDIKFAVTTIATAAVDALRVLVTEGPGVVRDAVGAIVDWVTGSGRENTGSAFTALGDGAVAALKAYFALNKAVGGVIVDLIGSLATWLRTSAGPTIYQAFKSVALSAVGALADLGSNILQVYIDAITRVYEYLTSIGARDIGRAIRTIGLAVIGAARAVFSAGGELYGVIERGHQAMVDYLREDAKADFIAAVRALLDGVVATVLGVFRAGGELYGVIERGHQAMVDYLREDAAADFKAAVRAVADAGVAAIRTFVERVIGAGGQLRQLFADASDYIREDALADITAALGDLTTAMYNVFHEFYLGLIGRSLIPDMFEQIAQYISQTATDLLRIAFENTVGSLLAVFKSFAKKVIGGAGIMRSLIDDIAAYLTGGASRKLVSAAESAASAAANALIDKFNAVLPDSISIPSVTIGGNINIPEKKIAGQKVPGTGGSINLPSQTIGGQSINIPQLQSGGRITDEGLAWLHAGEDVIAQADRGAQGGDTYDVDVTIQGDADRHDVKRGVSDALRSINAKR